jgi:collagenase-like PrtC family protease
MIRFSIGYQLFDEGEDAFPALVRDYQPHIAEVYYPWVGQPSGRASLSQRRGYVDWAAQARLEADLAALRAMGVELCLLFNANCYGAHANSRYLQAQVASILDHLLAIDAVDVVTTTSPAIAMTIKRHYPGVRTRASVNMRLGTVPQLAYVAEWFDEYCLQRDVNRDLAHVREVVAWAEAHGKAISLLANSGCLHLCSSQIFHDNLVAHEGEADEIAPIRDWTPILCRHLLRDPAHWPAVLQGTWMRPEDLHHYDGLIPVMKLATRMHSHPRLVLEAYTRRRYRGNLLDLFEPGFGPLFAPTVLDNDRFPADWFAQTSTCGHRCHACGYCAGVLAQVREDMHA